MPSLNGPAQSHLTPCPRCDVLLRQSTPTPALVKAVGAWTVVHAKRLRARLPVHARAVARAESLEDVGEAKQGRLPKDLIDRSGCVTIVQSLRGFQGMCRARKEETRWKN